MNVDSVACRGITSVHALVDPLATLSTLRFVSSLPLEVSIALSRICLS